MCGSHDSAQIVRIFNAVEDDEETGSGEHIPKIHVLMRRAEGDDALVGDAF